jgi:hypothetical protein
MKLQIKKGFITIVSVILLTTGCAAPRQPPVAESFIFVPPNSVAATNSGMSIAILKPVHKGNFFLPTTPLSTESDAIMGRMLGATQTDIEKSLVAKGFTTSGTFTSVDEMTFS